MLSAQAPCLQHLTSHMIPKTAEDTRALQCFVDI